MVQPSPWGEGGVHRVSGTAITMREGGVHRVSGTAITMREGGVHRVSGTAITMGEGGVHRVSGTAITGGSFICVCLTPKPSAISEPAAAIVVIWYSCDLVLRSE